MGNVELLMKYLKANVNMPKEDEEQLLEFLGGIAGEESDSDVSEEGGSHWEEF